MLACRIINTQWLWDKEATITRETEKQYIVEFDDGCFRKRFWKKNNLEVGYTKILRIGCEPDKLYIDKELIDG